MNLPNPTAIIADDEGPLRLYLKKQLNKLWPELDIVAEAMNGNEALALIQEHRPTIAFLDIQMPGMSGLEVAETLGNQCRIVFVTAFDHYAVEAFENAAVDYLLKPVSETRLRKTLHRIQSQEKADPPNLTPLLKQLSASLQNTPRQLKWIKVSRQDETCLLNVNDIDYFLAADKYTSLYTGGKEWLIRTPLKVLEASLDPDQFWRIHRSTLVRVAAIQGITRDLVGRYTLQMQGYAKPLGVSRGHAHLFKQD